MEPDLDPARVFVDGVATSNPVRIAGVLDPRVHLRALTPSGLVEEAGPADVVERVLGWFGHPDVFTLESWTVEGVGERVHLSYRFLLHDDEGWYRIDQEAFADVARGRIAAIDLVCSGFEPVAAPDLVVLV